jgi:hypothetical protein
MNYKVILIAVPEGENAPLSSLPEGTKIIGAPVDSSEEDLHLHYIGEI